MIKCGVLQACATNAVSSCNMRSGSRSPWEHIPTKRTLRNDTQFDKIVSVL